ncbi:MAG: gluconate 2-dehydrogenase subunit 3 family protein [Gammaproteobacteria bacterium]|nr:gluconate 2-dehydrogenase subunit 3 family protein [Gammaproteobacteria bacterium]
MDRRQFLVRMGATSLAFIPTYSFLSTFPSKIVPFKKGSLLSSKQLALLETLTEHFFPTEPDAPGAREINATGYLAWVIEDPKLDVSVRTFLVEGFTQLEHVSRQKTQKEFSQLSYDEQESVLRILEDTPFGHRWLKTVLDFVMEALLSDPIYGGNTGGAGWKWLHHTPPFPSPPQNKRYFLL